VMLPFSVSAKVYVSWETEVMEKLNKIRSSMFFMRWKFGIKIRVLSEKRTKTDQRWR